MKGKLTKLMMVAMMLVTVFGLAASLATVASTTTVAAATNKWSRMDLPTTESYQMFPQSMVWDLSAGDDGTLFALVEDTSGPDLGCAIGGAYPVAWRWDGLRWAIFPANSDIAVMKSTDGGYTWDVMWNVPNTETGAPIAVVPQPGYVDGDSSKDVVFVAMGTRFLGNLGIVSGGASQGNLYRSLNGGDNFTRVNPRCPAVTLTPAGAGTGGTITSIDVAENQMNPGTYMAIVGVSSLNQAWAGAPNRGEGVYTWNRNDEFQWDDLQLSNALPAAGAPPIPGTMPAGNGLDVVAVVASPSFMTDGLIAVTANDITLADPANAATAMIVPAIYVCFYDSNDGSWGGDVDSPTNAIKRTGVPLWTGDYAQAASMAVGTDFNNITSANVFVGFDGCAVLANDDVWRVRGLATVTGPSTIASCNVFAAGATRISDLLVPGAANDAVYVGADFPIGQAQVIKLANATVWPGSTPSFKPPSGAWPTLLTDKAGTVMAAGGGDALTSSGVHKMVNSASRGPVFNGVGLMDDIAVSEDIPGYVNPIAARASWCLAEAVSEEISPLYDTDGFIYVGTYSDWVTGLSLWRLTNGKWERIMYEGIALPNAFGANNLCFAGKFALTNWGLNTYVRDWVWVPQVVPQFSTDGAMFLLGGRDDTINLPIPGDPNYEEVLWYSPDKGDVWTTIAQMPIGAYGPTHLTAGGLSESGWYVQDSNTIFVGDTGVLNPGVANGGWIYKTTNRGASWTPGVLTGTEKEITQIQTSPIYSDTGAAGTDQFVIASTWEQSSGKVEIWLSQDGAAAKHLENVGDEIYTSPAWAVAAGGLPLGGASVQFDKNWATNGVIYASAGGWLDLWRIVTVTAGGGVADWTRVSYSDVGVYRTEVRTVDPSAANWKLLYGQAEYNGDTIAPIYTNAFGAMPILRWVMPSAIEIGADGTVYVPFSIWDMSQNFPPDVPTPNPTGPLGRFTMGGVLRCLDGTIGLNNLKTTEWELCQDGRGAWDGLTSGRMNRAVPGSTHLISLTWDWKEWEFKLAFWEDTLSGAGPAPVSPLANATGVGALVADTSVNVPLTWQAKGDATQYEWQVSEDSAFSAANTKTGTTSDLTVTVLDLKPATTYFWRSRAIEPMLCRWNTAQQFTTVIGGETGAPKLITPAVGATISDDTPLFTWSGVASASNYQVQVATSPTFAAADIVIDEALGNVNAYEADKELVNGTYYWQVKGTNATTDTETPWSALGSFTLDTEAGGTGTPVWVWVLIVLGVLLGIVVLVLILRTRRPV